jgi:hypothetical protein
MSPKLCLFDVKLSVPKYRNAFAVVCKPNLYGTRYRIRAHYSWGTESVDCDTKDKRKVARLFREKGIQIKRADWLYSDDPHAIFTDSYVKDWHSFRGWWR